MRKHILHRSNEDAHAEEIPIDALADIIHDEFNNAVGTPSRGCLRL
jgi:hypothetical protein